MNYKKNSEPAGEQMTLFSQAGSLNYASHTQPLESDLEKKMNATCGQKCLESYGRFNRNGLWAKTFSALLIGQEGWFSKRCKLTWKVKGTKYNRMYFQLRVSTLPTNEIGFGLWLSEQQHLLKTPTAMDGEVTSGKKNPVSGNSGTLAQEIMSGYKPTMEKLGLLPTPRAMTINNKEERITPDGRMSADGKQRFGLNLQDMATVGLLPTPESFDWNSARHPELWEKDKKKYAEKGINLHCNLRQMARLSLLPTPRVGGQESYETRVKRQGHEKAISYLEANVEWQMSQGMLPTPISSEIHHSERVKKLKESGAETMASRKLGASRPNGLMDFLDFNQMLPTPVSGEWRDTGDKVKGNTYKQQNLTSTIANNSKEWGGSNSQLNPRFVAEMMGFPPNWLELPFQNTETNP
jgi:hypothetical protein